MKKPNTTYHYTGPIKRFGKTVVANWSDETQAVSEAQALNNLKYKAKKYLKLTSDAKVELNPSNLIHLEDLDKIETREYNRSYDPDYDIPDEMEEMYGGNIFMKDNFCTLNPGTVKLRRASKRFNQRDSKIKDSYIKMDAYDLRDIFGRYYDEGLKERYNLNVSEDDFCFTGTTKVTGSREDLERFVRDYFDNDHYNSNIYSIKSIKDWMPTKTPIDYITEKLDRAGIEYEIEDDVYGESAPFDTWITITRGSDSRADDIICSVVGSAYEWVRDRNGNRLYCKVVTDEDLIEEFNN